MEGVYESRTSQVVKGIFTTFFGAAIMFIALKYGHYVSKKYVEVPCVVKKADFVLDKKSYELLTEYDYKYKGRTYTSDKFNESIGFSSPGMVREASKVERALKKGGEYKCYVKEENPSEAYLVEPVLGFYLKWAVFFLGLYGFFIGAAYFFQALKRSFVPGARAYMGMFTSATSFLTAIILVYFFYPSIIRGFGSGNWVEVQAVVDHRLYDVSTDSEGEKSYSVEILYRYKYEGEVYRSNNYNFGNSSKSDKESVIEIGKKYPVGKKFYCYVNPDKPEYSVIEKEMLFIYLITFCILMMIVIGIITIDGWGVRVNIN